MRLFVLAVVGLLACPAFAANQYAEFNGVYEVISQDCVTEPSPDGHCRSAIYATEVEISGNRTSGRIDIRNPRGTYEHIYIKDEGRENLPGAIVDTTWIDEGSTIINHNLISYDFNGTFSSWSIMLERTAHGLKLTKTSSGAAQCTDDAPERAEFALDLREECR